jgi:integrase
VPRLIPAYRKRKGYQQAIVTLRDAVTRHARDYWLGPYNTPHSREKYHRIIADWEANGRRLIEPPRDESAVPASMTVIELCRRHIEWATTHLGEQDMGNLRAVTRVLIQLCGTIAADAFGPNKLRIVREAMIRGDPSSTPPRKPWSRKYINAQIKRVVRTFKWAASREMLPASVHQQLRTLESLRRGRTDARETDPVQPVADELVDAVKPFVSRQVWAMIALQRLTGARPSELFELRPCDIDMTDPYVWAYRPERHKTAHHGRSRTLYLGPRARAVIEPFLANREVTAPLFSPSDAESERRASVHAKRITPLSCGNRPGSHHTESPTRPPGDHYTAGSYARAILYACAKAFPVPRELAQRSERIDGKVRREPITAWRKRLGERRWKELVAFHKAHRWHPYQLRHSAATTIRKHFGLEAAQIALGHSSAQITDAVYAERDHDKAIAIMRQMG